MTFDHKLYALQFKHPFGVSSNTRTETQSVFIRIGHQDQFGYGEACLPAYLGETSGETISFFKLAEVFLNELAFPFDIAACMTEIDQLRPGSNAAKAAIDIALHDLNGKLRSQTIRQLYELPDGAARFTSFTIGIDKEAMMAKKIEEAGDFTILKIKAGTKDDRSLINLVRKCTDKPLYVDVNQGWKDKNHALEMAQFMKDQGVLLLEQPMPVAMKQEMAWLTERSPVPTIADESAKRLSDLNEIKDFFSGINIKLMKCTGISEALKMIDFCRQNKLQIMLGCMAESSCASGAMAQLTSFADFVDLDAPLLYKNDPFIGLRFSGGMVSPSEQPGIGVDLLAELFGEK